MRLSENIIIYRPHMLPPKIYHSIADAINYQINYF